MSDAGAVAVFAGPSLVASEIIRALPHARIESPACRGDVARLRAEGVETFLLIDGGFAHRLALSPAELVAALADGARVIGASSMGAIRAAECGPAGMEAVGAVAALYRLRVIADDDEVAVAVEPDRGFAAASVALVNVRFAVLAALRARLLDRAGAAAVLAAAKGLHFSERVWPAIFAGAGIEPPRALRALAEATDVKRRDARLAVARLAAECPEELDRRVTPARPRPPLALEDLPQRYTGHDPFLGRPEAELRRELPRWLLGSGRYRRYWDGDAPAESEVWSGLEAERALEYELMRWHAIDVWAAAAPAPATATANATAPAAAAPAPATATANAPAPATTDHEPPAPWREDARRFIAAAHGFADWPALERDEHVCVEWAHKAADLLARARRNMASTGE